MTEDAGINDADARRNCVTCTVSHRYVGRGWAEVAEIDGGVLTHKTEPYSGEGAIAAMKGLTEKFKRRFKLKNVWFERVRETTLRPTKYFRIHWEVAK